MSRRSGAPTRARNASGPAATPAPPATAVTSAGALNFDVLLEQLAERTAVHVVAKLQAETFPGWVDQATSPLGPRKHIQAVRSGALHGLVAGRRYLARTEDVDAYVAQHRASAQPQQSLGSAEPDNDVDDLAASLGLDRR